MEVSGDVGHAWVFKTRSEAGVVGVLEHEVVCEVRRGSSGSLGAPGSTEATAAAVSVLGPDIITTATHVIDDGVGVNPETEATACLDHISQFLSGSMTTVKFIRNGLIVEPPRIQLTILRPFEGEDRFLRREDLNSHPASFGDRGTLLFNISVRPAEEFDDSTLLTTFVLRSLVNMGTLPNKIKCLKSY